jgi:hypothetical protein
MRARAGILYAMANGSDKLVVTMDGDDSEPIFEATVVLRSDGGGRVSTTNHRFNGERDREAEAALMREAAQVLIETAERMRNQRPRPPEQ